MTECPDFQRNPIAQTSAPASRPPCTLHSGSPGYPRIGDLRDHLNHKALQRHPVFRQKTSPPSWIPTWSGGVIPICGGCPRPVLASYMQGRSWRGSYQTRIPKKQRWSNAVWEKCSGWSGASRSPIPNQPVTSLLGEATLLSSSPLCEASPLGYSPQREAALPDISPQLAAGPPAPHSSPQLHPLAPPSHIQLQDEEVKEASCAHSRWAFRAQPDETTAALSRFSSAKRCLPRQFSCCGQEERNPHAPALWFSQHPLAPAL